MIDYNRIKGIIDRIRDTQRLEPHINEANTIQSIIAPIMRNIGWDTDDHNEFHREHNPNRVDGRTDIALMINKKPIILVECKSLSHVFIRRDVNQIVQYMAVRGVEWGVLTNGNIWRFYRVNGASDSEDKLFFEFDITRDDEERILKALTSISKNGWEQQEIRKLWEENNTRGDIISFLENLVHNDDLLGLMASEISSAGNITPEDLRSVLKEVDFPKMIGGLRNKPVQSSIYGNPRQKQRVTARDLEAAGILINGDILHLKGDKSIRCEYKQGGYAYYNGKKMSLNAWLKDMMGGKAGLSIMRLIMKNDRSLGEYRIEKGL